MGPITEIVADGTSSLFNYGPVITILVLVIILGLLGGFFLAKHFDKMYNQAIESCEKREDRAMEKWDEANQRCINAFNEIVAKNNQSHQDMRIAFVEMKSVLERK